MYCACFVDTLNPSNRYSSSGTGYGQLAGIGYSWQVAGMGYSWQVGRYGIQLAGGQVWDTAGRCWLQLAGGQVGDTAGRWAGMEYNWQVGSGDLPCERGTVESWQVGRCEGRHRIQLAGSQLTEWGLTLRLKVRSAGS